jgi:hypothetical protein
MKAHLQVILFGFRHAPSRWLSPWTRTSRPAAVAAAALLASALAAGLLAARADGSRPPIGVLFIGNSLTSFNDLPRVVEALSAATDSPIRAGAVVRDGFSLDDHLAEGEALRAIARGGWAFVVLQQGPSALPESQRLLRAAVRRLDPAIRRAGARTALYMVWPASARRGDFDGVRASYAAAAADVGGVFIPAGEAWRSAWAHDPSLPLYGADAFHPSREGSYLAALVIVQTLTGGRATTLPRDVPGWPGNWIAPDRARLLQFAAASVR